MPFGALNSAAWLEPSTWPTRLLAPHCTTAGPDGSGTFTSVCTAMVTYKTPSANAIPRGEGRPVTTVVTACVSVSNARIDCAD